MQTATARVELANSESSRPTLRRNEFATRDSRPAHVRPVPLKAAVEDAKARIRDAELDLEYSHVRAPFTGRIGARLVSIGSLIAGSRAATSPTTLLATLVSLDPIYLDFDMSESDFLTFSRARAQLPGPLANKVVISLSDENKFARQGTLDFVDNALDRSSGTIHARATVPNPDFPGARRVRAAARGGRPARVDYLLLPDSAVILDQSQHLVMTVAPDCTVEPKMVETGDLRGGLRVVRSGLEPSDRVIIDGLVHAMPGAKVDPQDGAIHYDATADGQG